MSQKLRIYYNAIFGAIGGLVGWFILGQIGLIGNVIVQDVIAGIIIGIFIGSLIGSIEGVFDQSAKRLYRGALYGAGYGLAGGALGLLVGELVLWGFGGGILGRAFGWMFLGLAVGISEGVSNKAPQKIKYGVIGGAIGGFLGGAIFEIFRLVFGSYTFSQALGLIILGASIGSLIGAVEEVLREAWVKVVRGRQEGKEFTISKSPSVMGRDELCDIALFGDKKIAKTHAELRSQQSQYVLHNQVTEAPTLVNGSSVNGSQALNDQDRIQVGDTVLLFRNNTSQTSQVANGYFRKLRETIGDMRPQVFLPIIILFSTSVLVFGQSVSVVHVSQVDKSDFPTITTYIDVLNSQKQPVKTLSESKFTLTENGAPVEVLDFVGPRDPQPMTTVLVLDRSGSMSKAGKMSGLKEAAIAFVRQTKNVDETGLIAFNNQVHVLQEFTADKSILFEEIQSLGVGGKTAYYDAVHKALELLKPVEGRKAVIAVTDGMDNKSWKSLNDVVTFSEEIGIPVYSIGLGNRAQQTSATSGIYEKALSNIAKQTGGSYFYAPSADQLVALYEKLAIRLQSSYKIVYRSPHQVMDGTSRNIETSVQLDNTKRKGTNFYYVPGVIVPASNIPLFVVLLIPLGVLVFAPQIAQKYGWGKADIYQVGQTIKSKVSDLTNQLAGMWPPAERFYLEAENTSVSPQRVRLPEGSLTIGAAPENDLVIDLPSVSSRHAIITGDSDRYLVEDLNSENGTFVSYSGDVSKERSIDKNALKVGSSVRFGDVRFYLSSSRT